MRYFVEHAHFTNNKLLSKATNYEAFFLETKAKKSHFTNNSKKITHRQ